jgi:hypothetical protein
MKTSQIISHEGIEVELTASEIDGVTVIQIVTDFDKISENQTGPQCRIYLNDSELYENPVLGDKS